MLLITKALVCLVFGVFLLVAPSTLLGILGANLGTGGMFTGREYGSALIGAFLLTWFGRNVKATDARGAILLYLFVYDAIAMVVTLQATLSGVLNALGWSIFAVYAFFAAASGCLMIREKPFRKVPERDELSAVKKLTVFM
jgi:hypothetical protein